MSRGNYLFFLFVGAHGTASVNNVVCNGKDALSFEVTSTVIPDGATWRYDGCPNGNSGAEIDAGAISKSGDTYSVGFNPYGCMGTPNAADASSYSVDLNVIVSKGMTLGGETIHLSSTQVALKCTFESTYTLTSDLGGVNLDGDIISGDEFTFTISLTMERTTSDYSTLDTSTVVANRPLYHKIRPSNAWTLSDFRLVVSKISVQKTGTAQSFDIFKHDMGSCGFSELDFAMAFDEASMTWTFAYKALMLDTEQGHNYQLVAEVELCHVNSNNAKCTNPCMAPATLEFDMISNNIAIPSGWARATHTQVQDNLSSVQPLLSQYTVARLENMWTVAGAGHGWKIEHEVNRQPTDFGEQIIVRVA